MDEVYLVFDCSYTKDGHALLLSVFGSQEVANTAAERFRKMGFQASVQPWRVIKSDKELGELNTQTLTLRASALSKLTSDEKEALSFAPDET